MKKYDYCFLIGSFPPFYPSGGDNIIFQIAKRLKADNKSVLLLLLGDPYKKINEFTGYSVVDPNKTKRIVDRIILKLFRSIQRNRAFMPIFSILRLLSGVDYDYSFLELLDISILSKGLLKKIEIQNGIASWWGTSYILYNSGIKVARNGVKLIDTDTLAVGGKIALGVEQAKGQILSFLEDDDLFLESKLQVILDVFAKDANLGYLHNSFSVIDDKGAYIRDRKYKTAMSTVYLSNESVSRKKISKVISHDKFHNMSSVSIKKEILVRNLQELSIVSLGPDAFMFYAALESGQYLLFLEEKLTMYRKHMSLSNRNLQYIEFMNWNRTSNESIVNELNGVQSSLENQMAKEVIEVKILEFEILSHIAGTPCKQSQMVSLLEGYLRLLVKFRLWHSLLLVMVSVAWFFSGNIARKMYYIRYKSTLGSLYES